jgi:hypothetical protein
MKLKVLTASGVFACLLLVSLIVGAPSKRTFAAKPAPPPPPPPLPPIAYLIQLWEVPAPNTLSYVSRMNNLGQIVGYMSDPNSERRGYLYDPSIDPDTAFDLNDIAVGVPDGWRIAKASGINDQGILVGDLAPLGQVGNIIRQAFVLDTNVVPPVVVPLPNWDNWVTTSGSDINENGDIFGYYVGDDGLKYAFLYNPSDPATPWFLSVPINTNGVYAGHLNNPSGSRPCQVTGYLADGGGSGAGTPFRWTPGVGLETFPSLNAPYVDGINDAGTICGTTSVQTVTGTGKKTSTTTAQYPMRLTTASPAILTGAPGTGASAINASADTLLYTGILFRDDWTAYGNYVDVKRLLVGSDADKAAVASGGWRLMNDRGSLTNAGQIAGKGFLLTPILVP